MQTPRFIAILSIILCASMPLSAKAALIFQFDFQVRVTDTEQLGDVSVVGNPTNGLTVGSTFAGSFRVEANQTDGNTSITGGRYEFSDLTLSLPAGSVFSLAGGTQFGNSIDIASDSDGVFLTSFSSTIPNNPAPGDQFFQEEIGITQDNNGVFSDVNTLNATTIFEIALNLENATVDYSDTQVETFINARNALVTQDLIRDGLSGEIFNVTVSQVPEPAINFLLLLGLGALFSSRYKSKATH